MCGKIVSPFSYLSVICVRGWSLKENAKTPIVPNHLARKLFSADFQLLPTLIFRRSFLVLNFGFIEGSAPFFIYLPFLVFVGQCSRWCMMRLFGRLSSLSELHTQDTSDCFIAPLVPVHRQRYIIKKFAQ